jgi:hypothetical protein
MHNYLEKKNFSIFELNKIFFNLLNLLIVHVQKIHHYFVVYTYNKKNLHHLDEIQLNNSLVMSYLYRYNDMIQSGQVHLKKK